MALELRLDAVSPKAVGERPLPPLQPFLHRGGGARFDLSLALDYAVLGEALGRQLAGRAMAVEGQEVQLQGAVVGAKDGDLVVSARLTGAAPGRVTIMAKPAWDADAGRYG